VRRFFGQGGGFFKCGLLTFTLKHEENKRCHPKMTRITAKKLEFFMQTHYCTFKEINK